MVVTRWSSSQVPGIVAILVLASVVLAATVAQARSAPERVATGTWEPPPCPGGIAALRDVVATRPGDGSWFRLDPIHERDAIVAHTLIAAGSDAERPARIILDREAFAWGPIGGVILAGSDDGARSRLLAFDPAAGCVVALGGSTEVIRRAVPEPGGAAIVEFRVDRVTRVDLGVWRRPLDGSEPTRLLRPIEPDADFGITWSTELAWSAGGDRLVVQSCGEHACRTRLLDADGHVVLVADHAQGPLVGLAGDRLVTLAACPGLPCRLRSTDATTGATDVLHEASGIARMVPDLRGRTRVVHEVMDGPTRLRSVRADGGAPVDLGPMPPFEGLLGTAAMAASDAETAPGAIPLGPGGRVAIDGVHLLDEVLR